MSNDFSNFDDFDTLGDLDDINFESDSDNLDDGSGNQSNRNEPDFSNLFENELGQSEQNSEDVRNTKKQAILVTLFGIIGVIIVVFTADKFLLNSDSQEKKDNTVVNKVKESFKSEDTVKETDTKVHIINENNDNNINYEWSEIKEDSDIEWKSKYTKLTFTITKINHYARTVDVNSNLEIKTVITGCLSGIAGTYSLDVPYEKGSKLVIGDYFTVQVKLGTYKDKLVIGDIVY